MADEVFYALEFVTDTGGRSIISRSVRKTREAVESDLSTKRDGLDVMLRHGRLDIVKVRIEKVSA